MYVEKRQELGRPYRLLTVLCTGRSNQSEKRSTDGWQGVGSAHSTLRTGEPSTRGRGRQYYAACKGNIYRTCRTRRINANLTAGNSK